MNIGSSCITHLVFLFLEMYSHQHNDDDDDDNDDDESNNTTYDRYKVCR